MGQISGYPLDSSPTRDDYLIGNNATGPVTSRYRLDGIAKVIMPWHNVMDYGAIGDGLYNGTTGAGSGTDDTVAIQAAYTAAGASGGFSKVIFPGRHAYKITATINITPGTQTEGTGGLEFQGVSNPPMIFWDGANNGVMFQVSSANLNIPTTLFENITISAGNNITNKPLNAIKFITTGGAAGNLDTGTGLKNVWIQSMAGDGVLLVTNGATNFFIEGGRFDSNLGYGIYADVHNANSSFLCEIYGNTNWVGGGSGQGKGFLRVNGEGAGADGADSHVTIRGLHTEVNQSLTQTFPTGANPYDQRGIISLGITPGLNNTQHTLKIDGWRNSYGGGLNSFCCVQITAATGTTAQASDCVALSIQGGSSLSSGNTDANATGEVRVIGGMVPSNRRYPFTTSVRTANLNWGQGKYSGGEGLRSYWHHRHGSMMFHGFGLQPETVADLDLFPEYPGCMAYVTDATATTLHTTVAGGSTHKVLVMNNGTSWLIIANLD